MADALPELNRGGRLVAAVDALPVCSAESLRSEPQLRRAYIVLCQLLHSYVHHPNVPWERLDPQGPPPPPPSTSHDSGVRRVPRQLAVPLLQVCARLGLPPVLTAAVDLWNWRRRRPGDWGEEEDGDRGQGVQAAGALRLDDLEIVSTMTGTDTEKYFHLVPCAIQACLGPVVVAMYLAPNRLFAPLISSHSSGMGEVSAEVVAAVEESTSLFRQVRGAMTEAIKVLEMIPSRVDPDIFYHVYRPLLAGFYPDGVCLEIGETQTHMVHPKGPSAGQSAVFILLDLFLGVSHKGEPKQFQEEMSDHYLPRAHRQLITHFRQLVRQHGSAASLVSHFRRPREQARGWLVGGRWSRGGAGGAKGGGGGGGERGEAAGRTERKGSGVGEERQGEEGEGNHVTMTLCQEHEACVEALSDFRKAHMRIAVSYLSRTATGTGSSSFKEMLAAFATDTRALLKREGPGERQGGGGGELAEAGAPSQTT